MLYSFVFHCNFSNPNRITKLKQIAQPKVVRFFCDTAERRKLAFVSDDGAQKTASAPAEADLLQF